MPNAIVKKWVKGKIANEILKLQHSPGVLGILHFHIDIFASDVFGSFRVDNITANHFVFYGRFGSTGLVKIFRAGVFLRIWGKSAKIYKN